MIKSFTSFSFMKNNYEIRTFMYFTHTHMYFEKNLISYITLFLQKKANKKHVRFGASITVKERKRIKRKQQLQAVS